MPSYLLLLDLDDGSTTEHTVDAACIHRDEHQVAFYAAGHELAYAVRPDVLLSIERLDDAEPDADVPPAEPKPKPFAFTYDPADLEGPSASLRRRFPTLSELPEGTTEMLRRFAERFESQVPTAYFEVKYSADSGADLSRR